MLKNGKFIEASREECDFVKNLTEGELLKYILLAFNDKLYNFFKRYIVFLSAGNRLCLILYSFVYGKD